MKIGICTAPETLCAAEVAGFAYFEVGLSGLAAMEEAAYRAFLSQLRDADITCEASNVMLPGSCRITGTEADHDAALGYLRGAFDRAQEVGIQVAVFGSSGARKVPDGFAKEEALRQMTAFTRAAGDLAAERGLRIALEPLGYGECNLLNTVAEGLALARAVNHPAVGLLADYYHMGRNGESMQAICEAGSLLWHCHIAHPESRRYPLPDDGAQELYAGFWGALAAIGYEGRVSIEGSGDLSGEGPQALAYLRGFAHP